MHTTGNLLRSSRSRLLVGLGVAALIAGCSSQQSNATRPLQVSRLNTSQISDPIVKDRIALSRFIGAWDFAGSYDAKDAPERDMAGVAAGTIEQEHFVLLDTARIVVQAGNAEFTTGAMLFSVEPGIGLMMTTWSEDSPAVHRFKGRVEADGSRFVFDEVRPARGNERLRLVMRFETDDRWVAEFYRAKWGDDVKAASYTFARAM